LAFLKPIATGWVGGPDGESRHSLLPGAKSRRAASLVMYKIVLHSEEN
jgi:hypothetical protein